MPAKVLFIDCETAPAKAHIWGLFNQNIGLPQVLEDPRIMGFGALWDGESRVGWWSEYHNDRMAMLLKARDLLDKADVVVHYNGNTFDTPWIQGELAREGIPAPSPFKQIDLYRVVKKNMRFLSHKLAYVSSALLGDTKVSHTGHKMWVDCLEGEGDVQRKAWNLMRRYCKQDVALLPKLLAEVRPYLPASINFALYEDSDELACQKCGSSESLMRRGYAYTAQRVYWQWQCQPDKGGCGGWTRTNQSERSTPGAGVTR